MIVGNRELVWADVFQSGGLWHFNIHRIGEASAVFESRFKDGHEERSMAISHAEGLIQAFTPKATVNICPSSATLVTRN